jgi:Tfp pilus assembly protein PilZ
LVAEDNRRRNRRVSAAGLAAYLHTGEAAQLDPRFVEDISGGGAFIRTDAVLPVGTPVALILVRPGMKKAVKMTAKVVGLRKASESKKPPGLRIAFDLVTQQAADKINELLANLGKKDVSTAIKVIKNEAPAPVSINKAKAQLELAAAGKLPVGDQLDNLRHANEILKHELAGRDAQIATLEGQLAQARKVIATRDDYIKLLSTRPR